MLSKMLKNRQFLTTKVFNGKDEPAATDKPGEPEDDALTVLDRSEEEPSPGEVAEVASIMNQDEMQADDGEKDRDQANVAPPLSTIFEPLDEEEDAGLRWLIESLPDVTMWELIDELKTIKTALRNHLH